jgi:hypothetical protein
MLNERSFNDKTTTIPARSSAFRSVRAPCGQGDSVAVGGCRARRLGACASRSPGRARLQEITGWPANPGCWSRKRSDGPSSCMYLSDSCKRGIAAHLLPAYVEKGHLECAAAYCVRRSQRTSTSTHKCGSARFQSSGFLLECSQLKKGASPHQRHRELRAKRVQDLAARQPLAAGRMSISEVTVSLGFSDQGHSYRRSKK